jgi:flagellar motor switch protein FliM
VIEPLMGELSAQSWFQAGRNRGDNQWGRMIAERVADARLQVVAVLAETTITLSDLQNLEVGDLLMTDKPASMPATVCIEAVPKFVGDVGRHKGHRAVRIRRQVTPTDRD